MLEDLGGFDLVPVVSSAANAERQRAAERGVTIEIGSLGHAVPIAGDADELGAALSLLIRNAVDAMAGRSGTLRIRLEDMGPVVRITFAVPAVVAEAATREVRRAVETEFGGDLSVAVDPAQGTVATVRLAVRP